MTGELSYEVHGRDGNRKRVITFHTVDAVERFCWGRDVRTVFKIIVYIGVTEVLTIHRIPVVGGELKKLMDTAHAYIAALGDY